MSIVFTIEYRYLRIFGDKSYLSQKIKGYLHSIQFYLLAIQYYHSPIYIKLIILLYPQPTQHHNMFLKKLTP